MIEFNSTIFIISGVTLSPRYDHTYSFVNRDEQVKYFTEVCKNLRYQNVTFIKKENTVIKVPFTITQLEGYDYIYVNSLDEQGKEHDYFYFILNKEYINSNCVALTVQLDIMQTYLFSYTLQNCFVEREHLSRYTAPGKPIMYIEAESLAYGDDYETKQGYEVLQKEDTCWFLLTCTQTLGSGDSICSVFHNSPTPYTYYLVPHCTKNNGTSYYDTLGNKLVNLNNFAKMLATNSNIISCSYIPYLPWNISVAEYNSGYMVTHSVSLDTATVTIDGSSFNILRLPNNGLGKATRRLATMNIYEDMDLITEDDIGKHTLWSEKWESKLHCYPYEYLLVTDWQSDGTIVKQEHVKGGSMTLCLTQALSHDSRRKYFVEDYLGDEGNGRMHNLTNNTVNDIPLLTDPYKEYLYSNRASATSGYAINVGSNVGSMAMSLLSGNIGGVVTGLSNTFNTITNKLIKEADLKATPDSVRANGNNINYALADSNTTVNIYRIGILKKWKNILGQYFHHYGYAVNNFQIPDINSRYYFNYVKTLGCNIKSDIDMSIQQQICQIFDNGITFWHYHKNDFDPISNYQYSNIERSLL